MNYERIIHFLLILLFFRLGVLSWVFAVKTKATFIVNFFAPRSTRIKKLFVSFFGTFFTKKFPTTIAIKQTIFIVDADKGVTTSITNFAIDAVVKIFLHFEIIFCDLFFILVRRFRHFYWRAMGVRWCIVYWCYLLVLFFKFFCSHNCTIAQSTVIFI